MHVLKLTSIICEQGNKMISANAYRRHRHRRATDANLISVVKVKRQKNVKMAKYSENKSPPYMYEK